MTNYEKRMQDMTLDQMAEFMNAGNGCPGTHMDEEFECNVPEDMSCFQCIKNWLMQEATQE